MGGDKTPTDKIRCWRFVSGVGAFMIKRDLSTESARKFWESVTESAEEVSSWPDWRRAGINVKEMREAPQRGAEEREAYARVLRSMGKEEAKESLRGLLVEFLPDGIVV